MPKNINNSFRSRVMNLDDLFPIPHNSEEDASHLLCPVRAHACYVVRTAELHHSHHLIVHYREHLRDFLCLNSSCHTSCVRLFHRHFFPMEQIQRGQFQPVYKWLTWTWVTWTWVTWTWVTWTWVKFGPRGPFRPHSLAQSDTHSETRARSREADGQWLCSGTVETVKTQSFSGHSWFAPEFMRLHLNIMINYSSTFCAQYNTRRDVNSRTQC